MKMTRSRVLVLLGAGWVVANGLLIVVEGVPPWLAAIGNIAGALVIRRYVRPIPDAPQSLGDRAVRVGAYVVLGTVAIVFALLLVVTMFAFLVAWLAS
jgi:hypothetical protein